MTAFNVLNGTPSTGNRWLNRDILRKRFSFDGVLVSDYAAIEELQAHGYTKNQKETARKALEAGVDFDMMTSVYANALEQLATEDPAILVLLDEAVWRILTLKNKLGLFENPYRGLETEQTGEVLTDAAKATATQLVEKSCVLLKNEQQALPLKAKQKIAVIGPYGKSRLTLGFWASVSGRPQDSTTLKDGLEQVFPTEQLSFATGYNLFDSYDGFGPLKGGIEMLNGPLEDEATLYQEALEVAAEADVILLTFGEQFMESGEGASKTNLRLPAKQKQLIKGLAALNKPLVGVLYTGRPLILTDIEPYFDSLLLAWYPGTMGGYGVANLLTGKAIPSARLSMTFPRSEGQIPLYYAHNSTGRPVVNSTHSTRFLSKYIDESNDPLFSFGHGGSYGTVTATWQHCKNEVGMLNLGYQLTNQSDRALETVVHFYVHVPTAAIVQPIKRLVASQRIKLAAEEVKDVVFTLAKAELSFYDNDGQQHSATGELTFYLSTINSEATITINI